MNSARRRGLTTGAAFAVCLSLGACSAEADPSPALQQWVSAQPMASSKALHVAAACMVYPSVGDHQRAANAAEVAALARADGVDVTTDEALAYFRRCRR